MEASSLVSFTDLKKGGTFHIHPAFVDALSQAAGFVINANESSNPDEEVFVNHGWKSFQLFEQLSDMKRYTTHVKMVEGPGKKWEGDVLVLDGDRVVACFGSIMVCVRFSSPHHSCISSSICRELNNRAIALPVGLLLYIKEC